jgi:hypothetical protein
MLRQVLQSMVINSVTADVAAQGPRLHPSHLKFPPPVYPLTPRVKSNTYMQHRHPLPLTRIPIQPTPSSRRPNTLV